MEQHTTKQKKSKNKNNKLTELYKYFTLKSELLSFYFLYNFL